MRLNVPLPEPPSFLWLLRLKAQGLRREGLPFRDAPLQCNEDRQTDLIASINRGRHFTGEMSI